MRQSHAAVLERGSVLTGEFATEPYEVGWAAEARWFIRVLDASVPSARLLVTPQISPDGLVWCDWEDHGEIAVSDALVSFPVREFGQWLRLNGRVDGEGESVTALIYLTLKD